MQNRQLIKPIAVRHLCGHVGTACLSCSTFHSVGLKERTFKIVLLITSDV
jgi:hypothetical protein